MRLCDICKEPDPFKRQLAIGRVSFERTEQDPDLPKYKTYDICKSCLDRPLVEIIGKPEV